MYLESTITGQQVMGPDNGRASMMTKTAMTIFYSVAGENAC